MMVKWELCIKVNPSALEASFLGGNGFDCIFLRGRHSMARQVGKFLEKPEFFWSTCQNKNPSCKNAPPGKTCLSL